MPEDWQRGGSEDGPEKSLAAELQQFLVPEQENQRHGRISLAGYFLPCSECGGDWWTASLLPDGRLMVLIADVVGHGVASAMVMGIGKAACDLVCMHETLVSPTHLLSQLNHSVLAAGRRRGLSMTCFVSILDAEAGVVQYANAGHTMPYLLRRDGDSHQLLSLVGSGTPLGISEQPSFPTLEHSLDPGDTLLWFTDGVSECHNPRREMFTEKRMRRLLSAEVGQPAALMRDRMVAAIDAFREGTPLEDDVTFVIGTLD